MERIIDRPLTVHYNTRQVRYEIEIVGRRQLWGYFIRLIESGYTASVVAA